MDGNWPCEIGDVFEEPDGRKLVVAGMWTCPAIIFQPLDGGRQTTLGICGLTFRNLRRSTVSGLDVLLILQRELPEHPHDR